MTTEIEHDSYQKRHFVTQRIGGGMFTSGAGQDLVGAISDSKGPASSVGAIIWGMGAGELRVARSLARLGIVAMQLRQKERGFARLNTEGVSYCREAIEALRARRGLENFILFGNCGRASISFYAAVDDPRVVGRREPHPDDARTHSSALL